MSVLISWVERLLDHLWGWAAVMFASGWLLGVSAWPVLHGQSGGYMLRNDLPAEDRLEVLKYGAVGVVVVAVLYAGVWLLGRRRGATLGESLRRFSRGWMVTLCAPLLVALFCGEMESLSASELHLRPLSFIAMVTGLVLAAVHGRKVRPDLAAKPPEALLHDRGLRAAVVLGIVFAAAMSHMTMELRPIDPWHVAQAWWLGSAAVPVYLIARRALPDAPMFGVGLVGVLFLHPAAHGIHLAGPSTLAVCVPLVLWAVHLIDTGARWYFVPVAAALLLLRADAAYFVASLGLYALVRGRALWGLLTIAAAVGAMAAVAVFVSPEPDPLLRAAEDAPSYAPYYADILQDWDGVGGLLGGTAANPVYATERLFADDRKTFYLLEQLLAVLMLPLLCRGKRVLLVYGALAIGLATRSQLYNHDYHYAALLWPLLIAAVPGATDRVCRVAKDRGVVGSARHLRGTLLAGMLVAAALSSARFGALMPNPSYRGRAVPPGAWVGTSAREQDARVRELVAMIPDDAVISVTPWLFPYVAGRPEVHVHPKLRFADYILWDFSTIPDARKSRKSEKAIRKKYETIAEHDGLELLHRTAPKPARHRKKD